MRWLESWHRFAQPGKILGISPVRPPAGAADCQQTDQPEHAGARKLVTVAREVPKKPPPCLSIGAKNGQSAQDLASLTREMPRNLASRRRGRPS